MDDIEISDIITDKLSKSEVNVLKPILKYLIKNEMIDNSKAQELTYKSTESMKKYLSKFVRMNILIPIGENKGRKYKLNSEILIKEPSEN